MAASVDIVLKGVDNASGVIKSVEGALGGLGNLAAGAFSAAMSAATAGVGALAAGLAYSISQAADAEKIMAQTEAVIKSTGGAAGLTAQAVSDLATSISANSTYADDAVQSGENLLLTFTNIGKDVFPGATQAMVDMAAAMGTDVSSGAIQLGKALNDPVEGISALSRVGVTFTEEQKKFIKSLVDTGDVAGAQKIILAELNKEFGGSAAAQADTFAGSMAQLKNQFDNVAEGIGTALLPILKDLINTYLKPALPVIEELGKAFAGFITDLSTGDLETALSGLADWDVIRGLIDQLGLGGAAWYQFANSAQVAFDGLKADFDNVAQAFQTLMSGGMGLQDFAVYILKLADEYIPGLDAALRPLVLAVIGLGEAFAATMPQIEAIATQVITNIGALFSAMAPQLLANMTAAITAITDLWTQWGPAIVAIVGAVLEILTATISGALLLISGVFTAFLQLLTGDWSGAWQTLQDTGAAFMAAILAMLGTNLEAVRTTWQTNFQMLVTIVEAVWGQIMGKVGEFVNVGSAIVNGIASGISGAAAGLAQAAVDAANGALNAAKSALGIRSPSTVFAEVGQNMMAGMSAGIDANAGQVAQSTQRAAGAAVSSVTNNYTLSMNNYGGAPHIPTEFQRAKSLAGAF